MTLRRTETACATATRVRARRHDGGFDRGQKSYLPICAFKKKKDISLCSVRYWHTPYPILAWRFGHIQYPTSLCNRYAMSGTDMAHGATRSFTRGRKPHQKYPPSASRYAILHAAPTRCPVLT
eukprot:361602-Rhodomonas_salina.2